VAGARAVDPVVVGRGRRSAALVLVLTVLGVVPGVGLLAAGRWRSGLAVLAVTVAAVIAPVAYVGTTTAGLVSRALDDATLRRGALVALVVAVAWSAVIVASHRALRPAAAGSAERVGGAILVGLLCVAVSTPLVLGANVALTTRATLTSVFAGGRTQLGTQATVGAPAPPVAGAVPGTSPTAAATGYRWSKRRLNILILGGDAGNDRTGTRTDSMAIASIDTVTGKVLLISVPRNLCRLDWKPGTPLARTFPDGWVFDPSSGCTGDDTINAVYNDVPRDHPGLFPPGSTANPGADALALGLQYSLGLPLDYYLLVDLTAFGLLVDAIGGVTVNITTPIPVGGVHDGTTITAYPSRWLMPAPDQHLDGKNALWFARGRFWSDDYDRIARQKCMINAIIAQTTPAAILTSYAALASTLKSTVKTNIPATLLDPLAQLGLRIRRTTVLASITLRPRSPGIPGIAGMGTNDNPDWAAVRTAITQAINKTDPTASTSTATAAVSGGAGTSSASSSTTARASATPAVSGTTVGGTDVITNVGAGCAYDQQLATTLTATWQRRWGAMYTLQGTRR